MPREVKSQPVVPAHEGLLSLEQLSLRTGFSVQFLKKARRVYDLPFYKIGKLVRFRMSDFEGWIEKHRHAV